MTVGRISRRAVLCRGSGSMYHPFLVFIRNGNGSGDTSQVISGISWSSDLHPLHSTIQSSSGPILKEGGGWFSDSTMTSIKGTARGSMWECSNGGYLILCNDLYTNQPHNTAFAALLAMDLNSGTSFSIRIPRGIGCSMSPI